MSPGLLEFAAGFGSCGLLITLYLLNELIKVLKEVLIVLKEELKDE